MSTFTIQADITLTPSAAQKLGEIFLEEKNPDSKLRIYVTGGGCSGFQYGFDFADQVEEDDVVIEKTIEFARLSHPPPEENHPAEAPLTLHLPFVIDAMSLQYLNGIEIDFKEDIQGPHFTIRNPQAKNTCGCGSSFSIDE